MNENTTDEARDAVGGSLLEAVVSFKQFSRDVMNEHAIAKDGTVIGSLALGSGGKYFFWPKHNCGPLSSAEMRAIAGRMDAIGS